MVQVRDDKTVFVNGGLIAPLDNATFVAECIKLDIVQTLLKKETDDSKAQRDQYWLALSAIQSLVQAQRNSMAGQEKVAVPAAQMNDAALTARMLKMAQDAYPTWGIVRLIIVESAWRPETNALGQIIHRRINTKVIYPRGNGFVMTKLSFIEPYSGGGTYGEARPFGIGTDTVAVDYK
jgi:RNA-binding protein YhbY